MQFVITLITWFLSLFGPAGGAHRPSHFHAVHLESIETECTNAGGQHATLSIADRPGHLAHAGGHAVELEAPGNPDGDTVVLEGFARASWYVAELLDGPTYAVGGGCLAPHTVDAEVIRLWPMHDEHEAESAAASGTAPAQSPTYVGRSGRRSGRP